jgi:hypothetical protein
VLGRAVADHGEHRVDRYDATDEERDGEQAEIGQDDDDREAADDVEAAQQAGAGASGRRQLRGRIQRRVTTSKP